MNACLKNLWALWQVLISLSGSLVPNLRYLIEAMMRKTRSWLHYVHVRNSYKHCRIHTKASTVFESMVAHFHKKAQKKYLHDLEALEVLYLADNGFKESLRFSTLVIPSSLILSASINTFNNLPQRPKNPKKKLEESLAAIFYFKIHPFLGSTKCNFRAIKFSGFLWFWN